VGLSIFITLTCDTCGRVVSGASNGAGLNASRLRTLAQRDYGWVTGKKVACLDHRAIPIPFHDFTVDPTKTAYSTLNWGYCTVCRQYDNEQMPGRVQHRSAIIEAKATELRENGRADHTYWR